MLICYSTRTNELLASLLATSSYPCPFSSFLKHPSSANVAKSNVTEHGSNSISTPSVPATLPSSQTSAQPIDCAPQSQEHEDAFEDHTIVLAWLNFLHPSGSNKHVFSRHRGCMQNIVRGIAVWLPRHCFDTPHRIVGLCRGRSVAKCRKGKYPRPIRS